MRSSIVVLSWSMAAPSSFPCQAQHDMLGEALELCDKALALRSGRDTPFVADTFVGDVSASCTHVPTACRHSAAVKGDS